MCLYMYMHICAHVFVIILAGYTRKKWGGPRAPGGREGNFLYTTFCLKKNKCASLSVILFNVYMGLMCLGSGTIDYLYLKCFSVFKNYLVNNCIFE